MGPIMKDGVIGLNKVIKGFVNFTNTFIYYWTLSSSIRSLVFLYDKILLNAMDFRIFSYGNVIFSIGK